MRRTISDVCGGGRAVNMGRRWRRRPVRAERHAAGAGAWRRVALRWPLAVLAALVLLALPALVHVEPAVAVANTWSPAGSMASGRYYHTATLLPNGKVLVAGGIGSAGALASAELYDPGTDTWSSAGSLATARVSHTATLLANGKVLVAGGIGNGVNPVNPLTSAELYDPVANTWSPVGSLADARSNPTATLLPNGKVLVAGGIGSGVVGALASAELYDPDTNTWSAAGSLATARYYHTATLLPNGNVLVAGGIGCCTVLASAELYDPATNTWSAAGSLATARWFHTATLLLDGKVLAAGGMDVEGGVNVPLTSAELYDAAPVPPTATNTPTNTATSTATNTPVPPTATNTATLTATPTATPTTTPKCADVNGDGVVTFSDVVAIGLHLGLRQGQPGFQAKYDLDGNGRVNIFDVLIALSQLGRHCRQ